MHKKTASRQVRIIAGTWKRTPLVVLDAPGLRPTPDRVRETVFNWLNVTLECGWQNANCLDLFAGSGALGFEAASRGAASVTLVDAYLPVVKQLQIIKTKLSADQVNIVHEDAQRFLKNTAASTENRNQFDIIFLDPPYHRDLLAPILPVCVTLIKPGGLLYLEAEKQLGEADLPECLSHWKIIRQDHAGQVHFHLLQRLN